jgi:hypothetical protein
MATPRSLEFQSGPQHTQVDYICVAADLLQKMMSALQCVTADKTRHDLRQRLHVLRQTVALLTVSRDAVRSIELTELAKALIVPLARDLERLAVHVESEPADFHLSLDTINRIDKYRLQS